MRTLRAISIQETTYKGKIRPFGKTRGSLTTVPIAAELAADLAEWRKQSKDPSPEAFIFPGRFGGFMDSSNFRHRVLHKLAEELELPKLTFQVIRRTIATLAQKKGTVKDVQGMMRHSRTATTTDVYMQETPGRRAGDCQLDSPGVDGDWHKRAAIRNIRNRSSIPARQHPNQSDRVNMTGRTRESGTRYREGRKTNFGALCQEGFEICCQFAAKRGEWGFAKCLKRFGGPDRDRTDDLFHAMEARSQLRIYVPSQLGISFFIWLEYQRILFVLSTCGRKSGFLVATCFKCAQFYLALPGHCSELCGLFDVPFPLSRFTIGGIGQSRRSGFDRDGCPS